MCTSYSIVTIQHVKGNICPRQVNVSNFTMYFPKLLLEDGFEIQTTLRSFLNIVLITELNTFGTFVFHKM